MNDGRTTGLMLKAMADASLNRGQFIEFHDHRDLSAESANALLSVMRGMAEALSLDYEFRVAHGSLRPLILVRWREGQPEPATVSESTYGRLSRISTDGATAQSRQKNDIKVLASAVLSILDRLDSGG